MNFLISALVLLAMIYNFANGLILEPKKITTTEKASANTELTAGLEGRVSPEDIKPINLPQNARTLRVPILMYHHVGFAPEGADAVHRSLTVSPEDFNRQVQWLHDQGYNAITLEQLYLTTQGAFSLPKKPIVLTFDDGYADVFDYALLELLKYNYVGSFAIITNFVGQQQGDNYYASWTTIASAEDKGMEIVSHTRDHFDGKDAKFSSDFIKQDLLDSKQALYDHLGTKTSILIYPYGHYTGEYIKIAQEVGFTLALTVHFGKDINLDNLMEVPRLRVSANMDFEKFKMNIEK